MPASEDNIEGHTVTFWLRVDAVIELVLKNPNYYLQSKRTESLVEMVKNQLKVEDRQAKDYIKEAKKLIKKITTDNLVEAKKKAIMDREALLLEANTVKDKLEVLKDRDDLKGLYTNKSTEKSEVTVKNIDMSQFTEYGLEKLKRGELLEDVLLDPKSLKPNVNTNTNSSGSGT